jgi:hypothetical protein
MYNKKNNAQKSRDNKRYKDSKATTYKTKTPGGGKVEVTSYSDGSSTAHFGGPCGPVEYDQFGREC